MGATVPGGRVTSLAARCADLSDLGQSQRPLHAFHNRCSILRLHGASWKTKCGQIFLKGTHTTEMEDRKMRDQNIVIFRPTLLINFI